jgi:O-methyltransferase involved in polyketide biosynthesis
MIDKVDFTGVESTMLVTLYLRAVESRSKDSILGDHAAAEAVDRIDYDFTKLVGRGALGNRFPVALRAKQLDEWAADFLHRHPDATVVQLGCGLDSRAFRLDLPVSVRWFDLDYPEVIKLRRRLYPEAAGDHTIGTSVTDPGWLEEIPTERPVLIIAEGLLMYLSESDIVRLLQWLADRFSASELLFDGLAPWVVRLSQRISKYIGGGFPPYVTVTRDGREIERWNSRFRYLEEVPVASRYAKIPVRGYRLTFQLMNSIPATRNMMRVFRYEF